MVNLFHDDYTGPRFTYGCWYRPPGYAQIPDGWIIGSEQPHPDYTHGTIQYARELTAEELASYQLERIDE